MTFESTVSFSTMLLLGSYRLLLLERFKQISVHWLLIPREDAKHFCPLHLDIKIAKKNTTQSITGWSNAYSRREETTDQFQ